MMPSSSERPGWRALAVPLAGSVAALVLVILGALLAPGAATETAVTAVAMGVAATWLGIAFGRTGPELVTGVVFAAELGVIVRALGGARLLLYGAVGFEIIALAVAPLVLARVAGWPLPGRDLKGRARVGTAALAGLLAPLALALSILAGPAAAPTPPPPPDAPS
jgi:hypothetical protein